MPDHPQCLYSIDRDDRLRDVDEVWLRFARDNGAAGLTRKAVLGRPIWQFIAGDKTRQVYELMFRSVRAGAASLTVPLRCDSPDRLRFMELRLSPDRAGGIGFECRLEREQQRPHMRLLERIARPSGHTFSMCSFCKRVLAFGDWLELEEAIVRLRLLETQDPPAFEQDLCGACAVLCRAQAADA